MTEARQGLTVWRRLARLVRPRPAVPRPEAQPRRLPEGKLILLLSAPRSGSTLLAHMLGNTGQVFSPAEPWLLLALEQLGRINLRSEYGSWHLDKALGDFLGADRAALLAEMARLAYAARLPGDRTFFLDKTPRYFWIVPFIKQMFPNENFIVLERNPLDIAASFKTSWRVDLTGDVIGRNGETVLFDLFHGVRAIRRLREELPNAHFVAYETLVQDPVAAIAGVLWHCGIDAAGLDLSQVGRIHADQLNPRHFGDHKIRQTAEVHGNSVDSWRSVLTPEEAELVAAWFDLDIAQIPGADRTRAAARAASLAAELDRLLALRRAQAAASYRVEVINPAFERRTQQAFAELFPPGPARG